MHMPRFLPSALVLLLSLSGVEARAADLASGLRECAAQADDAQRLQCFDAMAKALPAIPVTPEERFGYRATQQARAQTEAARQDDRSLEELVSTVVSVAVRARGLRAITLANGQVWVEKMPTPQFRVAAGDTVRIEPAALGSFLMVGPGKRSTRVTRLR